MFNLFKDCSLFRQLLIPMVIVGITSLCATLYSAIILEDSLTALEDVYISGERKLRVLEEIDISISHYRTLSVRHLSYEGTTLMKQANSKLHKTSKNILKAVNSISRHSFSSQARVIDTTKSLFTVTREYFIKMNEVVLLSEDFEKELAFEKLTQAENKFIPEISSLIQFLKQNQFKEISSSRNELKLVTRTNLYITIAVGIIGGSLILLIAYLVTQQIVRRLDKLLVWSEEISNGNFSALMETNFNDEVGLLNFSMGEMANKIKRAHGDLAASKKEAEDIAEDLKIYANAFENSGEAILITDKNNRIININKAFTLQTGYTIEDVYNKDPKFLASGDTPETTFDELWDSLQKNNFWQGELWDRKKSGERYPKWTAISAICDINHEVLFYIASFTDISERKETEEHIEYLAHHDALTGLFNRVSLVDRTEQSLVIAERENKQIAVLYIDLDRFKNINDSLGHHMGDQLLIEVAKRLKSCVRKSDIVARIGGDEFVITLTNMTNNSYVSNISDEILKTISRPYEIDREELTTSPSIGISIFPEDGDNVDELMRNADVAMYFAKEHGRNNYHFFTESMYIAARERQEIEHELRFAIDNKLLELYYQPQINTENGHVCTVEALARWTHPHLGSVPPDVFIPIAEESGSIIELGNFVLDQACQQLAIWKNNGFLDIRMSINLSVKQLQSMSLVDDIAFILDKYQLEGKDIELEITETTVMTDPDFAVQQLSTIRNLDIGLAIDDFGTGYSSLAYLKRLPIQTLKLDRSFVGDIEADQNDAEICTATIALAHNLGLAVVAEGVETVAQYDFLVEHKCNCLQGYLFSKPLPEQDILNFLGNFKLKTTS
jgi:diguanylate cyclase (GGDEF)-like protein/PAS domain S-box-containing protein